MRRTVVDVANLLVYRMVAIMKHYTEHKLKIDTERLGKEYLDFKHHLGFRTDNPANIDFNAICINRIPDDERSITGGNVRGLYWTYPDSTNVEEQRLPFIEEERYTEICPEFKGSYVHEVYQQLTLKWKLGRCRFLMKPPRSCLSWHRDPEPRLHIPIITNKGCIMVIENEAFHMPANGSAYVTRNDRYHNFFNGSEIDRVHLVCTVLGEKSEDRNDREFFVERRDR